MQMRSVFIPSIQTWCGCEINFRGGRVYEPLALRDPALLS
jgi:hypothetical protein